MSRAFRSLATAFYGLAVVANGLLSLLGREGGKAGLWFGLVMGAIALGASVLLLINQRVVGTLVAWIAIGFVGGWFAYDVFVKKGFGQGELRMYVVIVLSLAAAVVLCWPAKATSKPVDQERV